MGKQAARVGARGMGKDKQRAKKATRRERAEHVVARELKRWPIGKVERNDGGN